VHIHANAIAAKLEITRVIAQVLSQQKEQVISKLKEEEHKIVAM
jgi:cation transport ATPase